MNDQGGGNYHYRYHGEDKGVETTGDGALSVSATAGKLTVNAAKLNSGKNRVQLYGAKGIDVSHGEIVDKEVTSSNHKGGGLFSRSHTRDYESWEAHQVKTSDITGDTVALVADRGDITLKAGENTYHSEERHSKHKVGLMGSGGIGVTLGSRSQSSDNTLDFKGHTPTLVGAIDGNATIHAGRSDTLRIPRHQFCHFINCYSTTEPFQQLWSQFIDSHPKPQKHSLASHNCYYFIGYHLAISIYAVLLFSPFQVVPVFTSTQRTAVLPSCRLQLVILASCSFASSACT